MNLSKKIQSKNLDELQIQVREQYLLSVKFSKFFNDNTLVFIGNVIAELAHASKCRWDVDRASQHSI